MISELKILDKWGDVSHEENDQEPPSRIQIQNTDKKEPLFWNEIPNTENQNITDPSTTKPILTHEDKINLELIKIMMSEKKTILPSLRNQDWKKVKVRTERINKLVTNIIWSIN